jgi:hypothetical protein
MCDPSVYKRHCIYTISKPNVQRSSHGVSFISYNAPLLADCSHYFNKSHDETRLKLLYNMICVKEYLVLAEKKLLSWTFLEKTDT